jgi:hypothetical protein
MSSLFAFPRLASCAFAALTKSDSRFRENDAIEKVSV